MVGKKSNSWKQRQILGIVWTLGFIQSVLGDTEENRENDKQENGAV